jgi:hypothetical protein
MYDEHFEKCGLCLCECTVMSLNWKDMKSTKIVDQDVG